MHCEVDGDVKLVVMGTERIGDGKGWEESVHLLCTSRSRDEVVTSGKGRRTSVVANSWPVCRVALITHICPDRTHQSVYLSRKGSRTTDAQGPPHRNKATSSLTPAHGAAGGAACFVSFPVYCLMASCRPLRTTTSPFSWPAPQKPDVS